VVGQLRPGDELLVDINEDSPWGHRARNRMMPRARADALVFLDDDDVYVPGALEIIRSYYGQMPDRMHIFRMRQPDGSLLWSHAGLALGNVSTQMICVPNGSFGQWNERAYEGDWHFIQSTAQKLGTEPLFHQELISLHNATAA
jgi:hypothetical protein